MLEEASSRETRDTSITAPQRNPFRKAWGLQKDGDLWQVAWIAIATRGVRNQDLRKVKGHATAEDIRLGRSNVKDKQGNDKSDDLADKGVESINGTGLVKLGKWIADRHHNYGKFMRRIHKMIAVVILAEQKGKGEGSKSKSHSPWI